MTTDDHNDYEATETCVEVTEGMTEAQFRRVGEILEQPLGRFKGWSRHFVFMVDTDPSEAFTTHVLAEFLREQGLAHKVTVEHTWVA